MTLSSTRGNHKYQILRTERKERPERIEGRIKRDIRGWIGWDFIEECANLCKYPLAVLLTFLTGGRASEILDYTHARAVELLTGTASTTSVLEIHKSNIL
jgi:hypothetical protein